MSTMRKPLVAAATAAMVAVGLAACGGGSTSGGSSSNEEGSKGGPLYDLTFRNAEHLDPQRAYIGRDLTNLNRLVYRGLVTFPLTDDPDKASTPVADLATDTGTASDDAKTWEFTIRDDVKWEDGKPV